MADLRYVKQRAERERERWSRDLLKHTPMVAEQWGDDRAREEAHRSVADDDQPFMVVYFGMLDYGVLWVGEYGNGAGLAQAYRREVAERELEWWRARIEEGLELLPFAREPLAHCVQVRQQWSLDSLERAIRDSYRYD